MLTPPRLTARVTLLAALSSISLAGCAEAGLHAPPVERADDRALLQLQSLESMESNEMMGTPTVQGAALLEVLALRGHLPPSQRALADSWIGPHVALFAQVYARFTPSSFPRECPFRQAERAFAAWLQDTGREASPDVFEAFYALPDEALPTLDRIALAVDRLPHDPALRDGFVAAMIRRTVSTDRFAAALARRGDPALSEKVFTALLAPKPAALCPTASWSGRVDLPAFVRLWNATYLERPTWTAGARALAASAPSLGDPDRVARALLQQAWRIWPDRRGALLYVIASASDPARYAGEGSAARFEVEIGPRPTDEEVASMAQLAPGAGARMLVARVHDVRAATSATPGTPGKPADADAPTPRETLDRLYGGAYAPAISTQGGARCLFPATGGPRAPGSTPLAGQARLR